MGKIECIGCFGCSPEDRFREQELDDYLDYLEQCDNEYMVSDDYYEEDIDMDIED